MNLIPTVVAVHLLAALPLAALVALVVGRKMPALAWGAIGAATAAGTALFGHEIDAALDGAGFLARCAARAAWSFALVAPWAAAGVSFRFEWGDCRWEVLPHPPRPLSESERGSQPTKRHAVPASRARLLPPLRFGEGGRGGEVERPTARRPLAAAVLAASCIPSAYVVILGTSLSDDLADHLRRQRLTAALSVAEQLCRLGTGRLPDERGRKPAPSLPRLRDDLRAAVAGLEREVQRPLPPDAPDATAVERGAALARLGRYAEAESLIGPLAGRNPDAELLLAAVLQANGMYEPSSALYARAVERHAPFLHREVRLVPAGVAALAGLPAGVTSDVIVSNLARSAPDAIRRGYDGLAYNARRRGAFDEAVRWYRKAVERLPARAADFRFALGMTFEEADRPGEAVAAFEEAARADPQTYGEAATRRAARLRREWPGCILSRPADNGRQPGTGSMP